MMLNRRPKASWRRSWAWVASREITPKIEETHGYIDTTQPENVTPDPSDSILHFVRWTLPCLSLVIRTNFRQLRPVGFTIWIQRQAINECPRERHHVFGKPFGEISLQPRA